MRVFSREVDSKWSSEMLFNINDTAAKCHLSVAFAQNREHSNSTGEIMKSRDYLGMVTLIFSKLRPRWFNRVKVI